MVIQLLILLPINFFIIWVWLWIAQSLFQTASSQKNLLISSIIAGGGASGAMLLYPLRWKFFQLDSLIFSDLNSPLNLTVLGLLSLYLLSWIIIFIVSKRSDPQRKKIAEAIQFLVIIGIFVTRGIMVGWTKTTLYFIFIASSEEFLKFFFGYTVWDHTKTTNSDIIAYAVLAGLWFWFFENFVYIFGGETMTIISSLSLSLARWMTSFFLHAIFTGVIWRSALQAIETKNILKLIPWIFWGIILHRGYNMALTNGRSFLLIIYILWSYIILSYLFYQTERFYLPAQPTDFTSPANQWE